MSEELPDQVEAARVRYAEDRAHRRLFEATVLERIARLERRILRHLRTRESIARKRDEVIKTDLSLKRLVNLTKLDRDFEEMLDPLFKEIAALETGLERRRAARFRWLQLVVGAVGGSLGALLIRRLKSERFDHPALRPLGEGW